MSLGDLPPLVSRHPIDRRVRMGCAMNQTTVPAAIERRGRGARAISPLSVVAVTAARLHAWAADTEARRRTEEVLRPIGRAGWMVAHNVRLPDGGRIDHLAAGPSGVYLLVSRVWQGVVTV